VFYICIDVICVVWILFICGTRIISDSIQNLIDSIFFICFIIYFMYWNQHTLSIYVCFFCCLVFTYSCLKIIIFVWFICDVLFYLCVYMYIYVYIYMYICTVLIVVMCFGLNSLVVIPLIECFLYTFH